MERSQQKTKPHVFFVDDEPKICKVTQETLERAGMAVECFADGSECLVQLSRRRCDLLIMDVRRQTKARLQRPYSDIVRFNRPDFNRYCYSVVLGDGPVSLLTPGKGEEGLYVFLSDLRVDYSPACSSQVHSFTTVMKRYRIWRYVRRVCCSTRYLGACKSTSKDAA